MINSTLLLLCIVMDIDGVIYRGTDIIPKAIESIEKLKDKKLLLIIIIFHIIIITNPYIHLFRIPHLFMTNGGGQTEIERAEYLSKKLVNYIKLYNIEFYQYLLYYLYIYILRGLKYLQKKFNLLILQ